MKRSRAELITTPAISARMKRVRQQGTDLELLVRAYLWRRGLRFTVHNRDLPGSPDLANRRRRWAVFVHGCFWHGHRGCKLARLPKSNTKFWSTKVRDNKRRDATKAAQLRAQGYLVVTVWGCEAKALTSCPRLPRLDALIHQCRSPQPAAQASPRPRLRPNGRADYSARRKSRRSPRQARRKK